MPYNTRIAGLNILCSINHQPKSKWCNLSSSKLCEPVSHVLIITNSRIHMNTVNKNDLRDVLWCDYGYSMLFIQLGTSRHLMPIKREIAPGCVFYLFYLFNRKKSLIKHFTNITDQIYRCSFTIESLFVVPKTTAILNHGVKSKTLNIHNNNWRSFVLCNHARGEIT